MTDSNTSKNLACEIVKEAGEIPSPTEEGSSTGESTIASWSTCPYTTDDSPYLCTSCRRKKFKLRDETTSEDGEYDSESTYNTSDLDSFNTSDTYSSSGSGYISLDQSSSIDDSRGSSDESSDTSSYYCDSSESLSSCSDTGSFNAESTCEAYSYFISLSAGEHRYKEAGFLEIEE